MSRILVQIVFLTVWFAQLECDVYSDRPKIKTSDGNLELIPAFNKNIYLRLNGPKSTVFVGDVSLLNLTKSGSAEPPISNSNDLDEGYPNGPDGVLRRLDRLERRNLELPNDLVLNLTFLVRRINRLSTRVSHLQSLINNRARDECQSRPCQNGGTCLNLVNGYHCLCPSNWEGTNCDIDVNECRNFAGTDLGCQNGASCINRPGSYECICKSGWFGLHCTRKAKDCSGGNFEMCGHGTCVPVTSGDGIRCICDQGWTTNGTGDACLTDINECGPGQGARCSVNPTVECINLPGSFRCGQCPPGYDGDGYICTDIDECVTIPNGGCSTSPLVSCHNTMGSRMCGSCPLGYQGDGVTCSWRGSCSINRGGCHPSAQCIDNPALGGQIAQCICPAGMEGDGVGLHGCYIAIGSNSTQRCESNPCGTHGQCHPLRTGYTCICYRGYSGAHCDDVADYCSSNPCLNGGTCRPDDSMTRGFRCECTAQYSGETCQVISKTCGGLVQAEEGSIVYPLTNTSYNHNIRCAWVIQTDRNHVLNVTFSKFNLEAHPECLYDFLQIHDGRSSASQIIGRFCGNEFPKGGNIISSHNILYLWFRTDQTVAKDGFALHWTSINPVCGGEIDASIHGHISSPGSPGKYPPNRDCYWHLSTTLGKRIQLHFFALDIEVHDNCSYDYIAIYDGAHTSDSLLNRYCNSSQPAPVQSAGSDLLIHFHSDAYGSGNGFQIAFAPTEGVPGCGGFFTADRGELVSPTTDGKYLTNLLCEYKIRTSPETKVRINFKSFHLESSYGCRYDYLKVYDGSSEDSRLVGRFCGTAYPKSYTSSSNILYIKFKTDNSLSFGGFRITYETVCEQTILGDSGFVKSPGYPTSYPENRVCEYIIAAQPGKAIQLTFQDFDIEDARYYNCHNDNIEIRDGLNINATLLGRYCGGAQFTPPVQTSTHNYMYLRFSSDMSISGTGFYANYTTIDTKCGGIYKETTGIINHPSGEDSVYENDQSCTWMLIAPEGMYIKLTWNRFDLENMPRCRSDYVQLVEIDDDNENNILGQYCGTVAPPTITTTSNRLQIKFESDSSVRSDGFSMSYSFLDQRNHCGGMFTKSHGYIYSPGWPNRYENSRDCIWTITAPAGQQIRLNISQFDLERAIRDRCDFGDFLEIRNGGSSDSPLSGKYCGSFNSKIIVSFANVIYLRFHSDSYITGNGFKIEWDSTATGCGGTLTSPSGSISSPNYPSNYNENAECFYRIVTSAGSRIQIRITDLDLERTVDCKDDYLAIYDGRTIDATSFGKYCFMTSKLSAIETSSNYAYIKFRSDFYIGGKGFLLNYDTICQSNLTGSHGVIESPGFPNRYPLNLNCLWTINVPKGNKINITFTDFNLFRRGYRSYYRSTSNSISCQEDYLQIKETTDKNFGAKLCGYSIPAKVTSKSNSMQIKFVTGSYFPLTGFRLEWVRYGCGGLIQKRYGSLSLDKSLSTGGEIECEWVIETPQGTSVSITIRDMYMTDSANCTTDALEIYNGQSVGTPLLAKICHKGSSIVQSSSNFMLIRFVKRSSLRDIFFDLAYDSFGTGCGGRVETRSGVIHSKNYPKNYDNNLDCIWTIVVPRNHRIELNFMDFDLYSNSDTDCADFIKMYDEALILSTNYTRKICPSTQISQIISNNNIVGIQFVSDGSGTAKGFKANFSITCGAVIKALYDGIVTNDKSVSHSIKNCTWTILAPSPDQKISLTITHMSIPKDSDVITNRSCPSSFLRVFDGNDDSAPLVDEYCGRKVPPMIVSHGSALTVQLGTYNGTVAGEFSAHYTATSTACGGSLTSEEGSIASPNFPQSYPVSASCEWTLVTSPGNKVYITFDQFDLEYSENCNEDYLEVRENDGGGALLGVYCGNEIPTNTTAASKLYIKFHSDSKNSGRGFLLHYGFLHGNEITGLEGGEVASPLFPFNYDGAGEYFWRIVTNGRDVINIVIEQVEIPTHGSTCYNSLTIYDGYDDGAPVLDELCGRLDIRKEMQTSSNVVYIKLKLDESNTGSLFHIRWAKAKRNMDTTDVKNKINCGSNATQLLLPGQTINFNSPGYPNVYENDLNCEWVFKVEPGRHIGLSFNELNFEETPMCFADYISIYSSNNLAQWKPEKENICLSSYALQETNSSDSSYMKIKFKTDSSMTQKGFAAKVTSLCGGLISGFSGVVGPIWADIRRSEPIMKCKWTVKVRPGRSIKLSFEHFNITNSNDDCTTFVTLRNGDSAEAPILGSGKYCGYSHENMDDLETSSNAFFVSYTASYSRIARAFQNFRIRYEEKNFECGVISTLDSDHKWEVFNSPSYPSVPVPYSECIWRFTGPPGEILRIDFLERFDLTKEADCSTEYVEIRDGSSELANLKGRFCNEKPGTVKTSSNMVYIKYLTQVAEPRNGFKANVSIDTCGGTILASKGELTSPYYPHMHNLPYGSVCEWRIIGSPRQVFLIKPEDINLPASESTCETKITIEESMPVNHTVTLLQTYCNEDINDDLPAIETFSNEIVVKLYIGKPSEWTMTSETRGFRFTFNSSRPNCGGVITTPEGYLTTPGYPRESTLRYCQWLINVPDKSRRVRLELLDSNLEKHRIGIFNDNSFQTVLQTLPSKDTSVTTQIFESSGNKLALYLWLDTLATQHRFKARFSSDEQALCGGTLSGIRGTLDSPTLERSYSCEWHYSGNSYLELRNSTNEFYTIYITAKVNSSVSRTQCRFSDPKLNIRSNLQTRGISFVRNLCGDNEISYRIPSTVVDLKATKNKGNSLYFHLEWKLQPCGGIINAGQNEVNILNIPDNYNETLDCAWLVLVPPDSRVQIKLGGSFQLDCSDEFIQIAQGYDNNAPVLGDYCKDKVQENPLITPFSYMYVQYHSNIQTNTNLNLMIKTITHQCGGYLSQYDVQFQSPNYPETYESNQECVWEINAELGSRISLNFIDRFVIEDVVNCTKDAVIIYDWKDNTYEEIARLCGRQLPSIHNSTYNRMKVVLRTDGDTNLDGFRAQWVSICGGKFIATEEEQFLYSPGYPDQYKPSLDCSYQITATNKKVFLKFLDFELEGTYPLCEFDNVTLNADSPNDYQYLRATYCGSEIPPSIHNYEKIDLFFKTDRYIQRKGFKLSYSFYSCGGKVNEPRVLSSGPLTYDNNLNCTWLIESPANKVVILKFLYIDLESSTDCYNDHLAVFNGLSIDEDKRLALMCGYVNTTTVMRSSGNTMLLQFKTDSSLSHTGFKVEVFFSYSESVGCGGRIDLTSTTTHTLKSPLIGDSKVYEDFLSCHWDILAPADHIIKIEFTSFHLASCINVNQTALGYSKCECDFVEIKDGLNPNSLSIGKYCGHTLPPQLVSSGNVMGVRLSTDGEIDSAGFEAVLSVHTSTCGQSLFTVTNNAQTVTSPGYATGSIIRGLHCVYHFEMTTDSYLTLHLTVKNLDLRVGTPDESQCNNDKLIITTVPTANNVSLSKDFIMNTQQDYFFYTTYLYDSVLRPPNIYALCGIKKSIDFYLPGSVTVHLQTSSESDSLIHKGVEIEVKYLGFCGRNYTEPYGRIKSAHTISDEDYLVTDCYTLITAPENHTISVYFIAVSPDYWNENVFLDVYDGNTTSSVKTVSIKTQYDDNIPVFSTGRYFLLHNHRIYHDRVSYDLNYMATDKGRGCGGKLYSALGRVTSPLYPAFYRQVSTCEWELETPHGTRLRLHFSVFDLGSACEQNYLRLVDRSGATISTYCSETPADFTSADNYVKIVFTTTMNNNGVGWIADFVSIL